VRWSSVGSRYYYRSLPLFFCAQMFSFVISLLYTDMDNNKVTHGKMGYLSVTLNQYFWIYPK
jgi:hypothetical protein